jgi:MYXO-CTERM domain-containing protein
MKPCRWIALAAGAAALLAFAAPARADYCRTKACDDQPAYDDVWQEESDPSCVRDEAGCLIAGQPLYWPMSCISFSVQHDGSPSQGIDFDTAHDVINTAFSTWMSADCGSGATPGFVMSDYGAVECRRIQYNQNHGNANVFLFRDDAWPHKGAENALALTTVTYNTENGQIYDADVEINAVSTTFTTTDVAEDVRDDLLAVLTHEAGHFLGLGHESLGTATMYAFYTTGDTFQRTLDPDDAAGICNIFPPSSDIDGDQCTPRHGFSRECGETKESGCGVSPSGSSTSSVLGLGIVGLVLGLRRRRHARRVGR